MLRNLRHPRQSEARCHAAELSISATHRCCPRRGHQLGNQILNARRAIANENSPSVQQTVLGRKGFPDRYPGVSSGDRSRSTVCGQLPVSRVFHALSRSHIPARCNYSTLDAFDYRNSTRTLRDGPHQRGRECERCTRRAKRSWRVSWQSRSRPKRFTNARRADRSRLTKGNQPRCISSFVLAGALSRVRVNSSSTAFHLAESREARSGFTAATLFCSLRSFPRS